MMAKRVKELIHKDGEVAGANSGMLLSWLDLKRRGEDRNFKEICQPLCIGSTWVEHYIETVGGSVKLFPALQELET